MGQGQSAGQQADPELERGSSVRGQGPTWLDLGPRGLPGPQPPCPLGRRLLVCSILSSGPPEAPGPDGGSLIGHGCSTAPCPAHPGVAGEEIGEVCPGVHS